MGLVLWGALKLQAGRERMYNMSNQQGEIAGFDPATSTLRPQYVLAV